MPADRLTAQPSRTAAAEPGVSDILRGSSRWRAYRAEANRRRASTALAPGESEEHWEWRCSGMTESFAAWRRKWQRIAMLERVKDLTWLATYRCRSLLRHARARGSGRPRGRRTRRARRSSGGGDSGPSDEPEPGEGARRATDEHVAAVARRSA